MGRKLKHGNRRKKYCKQCGEHIVNKANNSIFCKECREQRDKESNYRSMIKFKNKRANKICRKCGKMCYGTYCIKCNKSKGSGSVTRRRARVRRVKK